ncbi:MAG: AMIN domain-containing protein, partial [Thermoanaerobaculia bacterium]
MKTAILPGWMPIASWRAAASRTVASRTVALAVVALTVLVSGCSSATRQNAGTPTAAPAPPPSGVVSSARVRQPAAIEALELSADGRMLELTADRPLVWTSFRDAEGALVIELPNSVPQPGVGDLQRTSGLVAAVDVDLLEDAERPLTRLTVRTRESSEHSLTGDDSTLRIELLPVAESAAVALAYEPLPAEGEADEVAQAAPPEAESPPPARAQAPPPVQARPSAPRPQIYGTAEAPLHGPRPSGVVASQLFSVEVVERSAGKTVIRVGGDGEFEYSTFRLESPERFVVDLGGVINNSLESLVPVDTDQVAQVRVGQFKPQPEAVSRVVFDLQKFVLPSIARTSDGLTMTFVASAGAPGVMPQAAMADVEPVEESPFEESMPASPEAVEFEPAAAEPAAAEPTLVADLMAEEEPVPAAPQPVAPQVSFESPAESPAAEVPMYEPAAAAPPPRAAAARPVGTSDVAMFEAQEIQIEPEEELVDPVLASFGALVVSRREPEYVGEPIDMSLRQADLVETLRSFASISDLNFVIQPGVAGTVTVELKGVPWDQAMMQIL